MAQEVDFKSPEFRAKCVQDMEKILSQYPNTDNIITAKDMESKIFEKATSKEDYIKYVKMSLAKVALASRAAEADQPSAPDVADAST